MKRLGLLAIVACSSKSPGADHPVGARLGPALVAALAAADHVREPWRCAAADGPELAEEKLGDWQLSGHTLHRTGAATTTTIGVIADAGGAAPITLAGLGRLRGKLANVDLVITLGGMGATAAELAGAIGAFAGHAPIVVLAGDLEPAAAIAGLPRPMLDSRMVRRIELPGATIVTLPGASAASRLVPGDDGCAYRPADVTAVLADLTPRPGLRILASAEAPRAVRAGEPTGDLVLPAAEVDVVLHGPTDGTASPAQTGKRTGTAIGLTPGTSDATARIPAVKPSAGILTIRDGAWSWTPIFE